MHIEIILDNKKQTTLALAELSDFEAKKEINKPTPQQLAAAHALESAIQSSTANIEAKRNALAALFD